MPLDLNIQIPRWLQGEIDHLHNDDDATKVLTTGVALGSAFLQQKQSRENLAAQALEQSRTQKDMDQFPVWQQEHKDDPLSEYTPYIGDSRWGQQQSQADWMRKYQQSELEAKKTTAEALSKYRLGQIENGSVQAKEALDLSKQFTKEIMSISTDGNLEAASEKARILLMPKAAGGMPSPEAITALEALKQKYPPAVKPSAQTNEGKNIDLINRLKKAGDTEGATLIENILKARGHLGTDKAPGGKLSAVDASRMKEAEGDLKQANISLDKAQKALDEADSKHKADAQAAYNRAFSDRQMAHTALEGIRKKYEDAPTGSKPIKAPSVSPGKLPKISSQEQIDDAISQANEAIKNGADPVTVKKRLKDMGINLKD